MSTGVISNGEISSVEQLGRGFTWFDTGTHDSLAEAAGFVRTIEKRQNQRIAVPEVVAFLNGWIGREELASLAIGSGRAATASTCCGSPTRRPGRRSSSPGLAERHPGTAGFASRRATRRAWAAARAPLGLASRPVPVRVRPSPCAMLGTGPRGRVRHPTNEEPPHDAGLCAHRPDPEAGEDGGAASGASRGHQRGPP